MLNPALLAAFHDILPAASILSAAEDTRPYECDGLTLFRELPNAVLLPENEAQVVAILKLCHAARLPVVARGAGTGLSGGALPDRDGVILSLAKFRRILAIDPLARTAIVQPGVRNLAISEAAAAYGLYYAPDPSSQIACTIGGNVAENSGGVHCLKYGLTVHNVRRVRGALITGEVVEFGGDALDAPGYDLLALITGSEGLLAVITEVTVKLTPKPRDAKCVLAAFDDVAKVARRGRRDHRRGHRAGGSRNDGPGSPSARSSSSSTPAIRSMPRRFCCSSPMARPRRSPRKSPPCNACCEEAGATLIEVSRNEAQRLLFWSGRKAAFRRGGPHLAGLLLHGRHDSAARARPGAAAHRRSCRRRSACRA